MIRVADIRIEWPRIKAAVTALCQQDRPEDVYADCKHGRATLLVCGDIFAITREQINQHTGEKEVYIWKASAPNMMAGVQDELYALFRQSGATSAVMTSHRSGWIGIEGWVEETTFFRRAL